MKDSSIKNTVKTLKAFLKKEYIKNPSIGSPDISTAIRDVLTDLAHLSDKVGVNFRERLDNALEVYNEELES